MATTSVWSAKDSKVLVDSKEIIGLQSIEFKESHSRSDITGIGHPTRLGVEYGVKVITGKLRVKSSCPPLDEKIKQKELDQAKFTLQAQLKKGSQSKNVTFQECYLDDREYSMEIGGSGIATYSFTATDIQE